MCPRRFECCTNSRALLTSDSTMCEWYGALCQAIHIRVSFVDIWLDMQLMAFDYLRHSLAGGSGFLPPQQAARCKQLESLSLLTHPLVFLVPIHSLVAVLTDAAEVLGSSRKCVVGREMTKLHEEFWRGTLKDACRHYESNPAKVRRSLHEPVS